MPRIAEPIDQRFATKRMILDEMAVSKYPIKLRLRVILAIYCGCSRQEAADGSGVSRRTVQRWFRMWNDRGPDALIARHKRGPKRKISRQQFDEKILPLILTAEGRESSGWSVAEVQRKLARDKGMATAYSTLLRAFRWNGRYPNRRMKERSRREPAIRDEPWSYPWPKEYGQSLADFLKKSEPSCQRAPW